MRNSSGIVAGRRPNPHSVAIAKLFTYFSAVAAPARARDPVGVVHQAERELRRRLEPQPPQRLEIGVVRAVAGNRHVDQLDRPVDLAAEMIGDRDHVAHVAGSTT